MGKEKFYLKTDELLEVLKGENYLTAKETLEQAINLLTIRAVIV
jgi:hypothetical protein